VREAESVSECWSVSVCVRSECARLPRRGVEEAERTGDSNVGMHATSPPLRAAGAI
jgi:hypothetical protein